MSNYSSQTSTIVSVNQKTGRAAQQLLIKELLKIVSSLKNAENHFESDQPFKQLDRFFLLLKRIINFPGAKEREVDLEIVEKFIDTFHQCFDLKHSCDFLTIDGLKVLQQESLKKNVRKYEQRRKNVGLMLDSWLQGKWDKNFKSLDKESQGSINRMLNVLSKLERIIDEPSELNRCDEKFDILQFCLLSIKNDQDIHKYLTKEYEFLIMALFDCVAVKPLDKRLVHEKIQRIRCILIAVRQDQDAPLNLINGACYE